MTPRQKFVEAMKFLNLHLVAEQDHHCKRIRVACEAWQEQECAGLACHHAGAIGKCGCVHHADGHEACHATILKEVFDE